MLGLELGRGARSDGDGARIGGSGERQSPGKVRRLDEEKYCIARAALLDLLPTEPPGLTQAEMTAAMRTALPTEQFGTTAGWWTKAVQLDLEAKDLVARDRGKPTRWRRRG